MVVIENLISENLISENLISFHYFDLLSPHPIQVQNIGGIVSPKLRDIASIGYHTYQYYLAVLLQNSESCDSLFAENQMSTFEGLISNSESRNLLQNILNFFIEEDVIYAPEHNGFIVKEKNEIIGFISKNEYPALCSLICQRNHIKADKEADLSKAKNKKALDIMKKLQKGRAENAKHDKADQNMELGNIISAVANKSQSLNILNIWDLTVFQLWDCFARLTNNNLYKIQAMSVAAWGDKENHFDTNAWFKKIGTDN